jgi:hypothetical protein
MVNIEAKTKLGAEEAVNRMKAYFGKGGLGLELTEESSQCLNFEGGGGYITATACSEGKTTRISLVSQEWDYHAKKFLSTLP